MQGTSGRRAQEQIRKEALLDAVKKVKQQLFCQLRSCAGLVKGLGVTTGTFNAQKPRKRGPVLLGPPPDAELRLRREAGWRRGAQTCLKTQKASCRSAMGSEEKGENCELCLNLASTGATHQC